MSDESNQRLHKLPTRAEFEATHREAVAVLRGKAERAMGEPRRVALVHVRALRRSAARLSWWRRVVFWARVWRDSR